MHDIVIVVVIWIISLFVSVLSVTQPNGVDWYAPINSKQKMIMSLINISIIFLMVVILLLNFSGYLWKIIIVSVLCILIIILFSFQSIVGIFKNKNNNTANQPGGGSAPDESGKKERGSEDRKLLDVFSKLLTVFNSVFLLLNIVYILYICESIKKISESSHSVIDVIYTTDNAIVVHGTILFWTTISAVILTIRGWTYDQVDNSSKTKKRITHNADFFAKRIINRNRTRE